MKPKPEPEPEIIIQAVRIDDELERALHVALQAKRPLVDVSPEDARNEAFLKPLVDAANGRKAAR